MILDLKTAYFYGNGGRASAIILLQASAQGQDTPHWLKAGWRFNNGFPFKVHSRSHLGSGRCHVWRLQCTSQSLRTQNLSICMKLRRCWALGLEPPFISDDGLLPLICVYSDIQRDDMARYKSLHRRDGEGGPGSCCFQAAVESVHVTAHSSSLNSTTAPGKESWTGPQVLVIHYLTQTKY